MILIEIKLDESEHLESKNLFLGYLKNIFMFF